MRRSLLMSGLLTMLTLSAGAGPWLPGARKGFLQIGYSGLYYNSVYGPAGTEVPAFRNASDVTVQLYAEYGLGKKWAIRGVLPYKRLHTEASTNLAVNPTPAGTLTGLGNVGLGLKHALVDGITLGVDALANTFTNNDRLGLRTGYEGWTVLPYLSVGAGGQRTYYFAEVGYGFMTQNYSNFLKVNGEFGYKLLPRLWVAGTIDFRLPARNGPFFNTEAYQFSATYLNDQQFLGAGLKGLYDLVPDKLGLSASVIGALGGENVPFSRSYNAGIFIKW
ncbi:hypothetical protein ACAW74_10900 [Fibrella sp. WM1]|uniref:hypothetical protein n=1 Tax=Fibrella musci TaxID=3242485 RepID=UPI00352047C1